MESGKHILSLWCDTHIGGVVKIEVIVCPEEEDAKRCRSHDLVQVEHTCTAWIVFGQHLIDSRG